MKRRVIITRALLVVLLLGIGVLGTINMVEHRGVGFEVSGDSYGVKVTRVVPGSSAERAGIRVGDQVHSIDNYRYPVLPEVQWLLSWVKEYTPLWIGVRGWPVMIFPDQPPPLLFLILDRVTGIAFIVLGLLVWWRGNRDTTVAAFMRINLLTGVAVLLWGYQNSFYLAWLRDAYALAYIAVHSVVPAALMDFLYRFTSSPNPRRQRIATTLFYGPCIAIGIALSVLHLMAFHSTSENAIYQFEQLHRYGYGSTLVLAMVLSIVWLIYLTWRSPSNWERNRNRWLLLCSLAGIAPYVFLDRLPLLWGSGPLLPSGVAMTLLVIAPIGWGMALASFRMMEVEWTLSRTIVYLTTAAILMVATVALLLMSSGYLRTHDPLSLIVLLLSIGVLGVFAWLALVDRVKGWIDRIYYGDWFNVECAVQDLSRTLSGSLLEKDIVELLTRELPPLLKIEKATLLIGDQRQGWQIRPVSEQTTSESTAVLESAVAALSEAETGVQPIGQTATLGGWGYSVAIVLRHSGNTMGCLLLGRKDSGAPYSERDLRLLATLSSVAGMALANMKLNTQLLEQVRRTVVADLAGGIAHEIHNALSPLMGQAQLIDFTLSQNPGPAPSENVSNSVRIIIDMCGRVRRIAENLNHLSAPLRLRRVPLCLNDVAEEAVLLMTETAGRIKRFKMDDPDAVFKLSKSYDSAMPLIAGDPALLSQVFINLILNAADAIQQVGKGTLTVGTRYDAERGEAYGFVEDEGAGIPRELLDRVFQPYFTTKPEGKGTGMGLTLVRSTIEAHGGRVAVFSQEGEGTRVEFCLPVTAEK